MPRRRPSRAVGLLLLAAQAAALPKWLRWPGKTKEQKAVERVLNEFERDEFYGCIGAKPGLFTTWWSGKCGARCGKKLEPDGSAEFCTLYSAP